MITTMRRHRKVLQIGLLVLIGAFVASSVFVFGQNALRGGDSTETIARVNGTAISAERYQRRYQEIVGAYAAQLRGQFSPEMAERMGVPQQVVQDLVYEELIMQRAHAERLDVGDEELNARIQTIPNFHENGRFSLKRYDETLRRAGIGKSAFEDDVRRRLTRVKIEEIVRRGVKLTEGEVEQVYMATREEVRAAWALVELAPIIASVTTTDAELETYLKARPDEFRLPERRHIQYVTIAPKDVSRPVTEAEVEKYYAEHPAEFTSPPQVKAAHILLRVGETGGSEAEDKARAKADDVIRRLKAGEDFAKLAKEVSDDRGSAENGGDLGLVGKGEMVPAFEAALFALKKGELTAAPVRTPFGFHVIKAVDVREGGKKPLREVAAQIRERLQTESNERAAKDKAEEVRAKLVGAPDFMAQAKSLGLTPVDAVVPRRPKTPGAPGLDAVEEAAFELSKGNVSMPVKTPAGLIVLKAIEDHPPIVPPLNTIKDRVAASVKRQKAEAVALQRAKAIVTESATADFASVARKNGASVGESARFSRAKPADKLPGDVMIAALRASVGAATEPVRTPQGYYVLKVLERFPPDMKDLSAEREKITKETLDRKQSQAWQDWLAAARTGAKIESRVQPTRG